MMENSKASGKITQRSCTECRKRRRKCDRVTPTCSECRRIGRDCVYPVKERVKALNASTTEKAIRRRNNTKAASSSVTALLELLGFADPFARPSNLEINLIVLPDTIRLLGDIDRLRVIKNEYFEEIHPWMPVISKSLLSQTLSKSRTEPRADLVLLLLCMKLIVAKPTSSQMGGMRSPLYSACKTLNRNIAALGRYSTNFLQAGLLITLYELGHAIYPEAEGSVTRNAELGLKLGLNNASNRTMNLPPGSWAEDEERGRTWWGIVMLDRYVSLQIRGRRLSTPELQGTDSLPVCDVAWEADIEMPRPTLVPAVSARQPVMAWQAHSSFLLGKVVRYRLEEQDASGIDDYVTQLSSTIVSLAQGLYHEMDSYWETDFFCVAIGMCESALLALHMPTFCKGPRTDMSSNERLQELMACKLAADRVLSSGKKFFRLHNKESSPPLLTPLVPDSLFQSAVLYTLLWRATAKEEYAEALDTMKRGLEAFATRWSNSREQLRCLNAMLQDKTFAEVDNMTKKVWMC